MEGRKRRLNVSRTLAGEGEKDLKLKRLRKREDQRRKGKIIKRRNGSR